MLQGLGLGPASSPDSQAQEDTAKTSFTSRTKKVLAHLHSSFEGGGGPLSSSRKRRHPSSAAEHLQHAQASTLGLALPALCCPTLLQTAGTCGEASCWQSRW